MNAGEQTERTITYQALHGRLYYRTSTAPYFQESLSAADAAKRLNALESQVREVEALAEALRKIANWPTVGRTHSQTAARGMVQAAREALAAWRGRE